MPTLIAKRVTFWAQGDEAAFFHWMDQISCIRKYEGVGDEIRLHVKARPSDRSLGELMALFYRYGISIEQLRQFVTEWNRSWVTRKMKGMKGVRRRS